MTVKQDHSVGSSKPSEKTKTLWALGVTLSLALFLFFHHTTETKDHSVGWFHVKQKGSKVRKKTVLVGLWACLAFSLLSRHTTETNLHTSTVCRLGATLYSSPCFPCLHQVMSSIPSVSRRASLPSPRASSPSRRASSSSRRASLFSRRSSLFSRRASSSSSVGSVTSTGCSHGERRSVVFCDTCSKPLCDVCLKNGKRRGHNFKTLNDACKDQTVSTFLIDFIN